MADDDKPDHDADQFEQLSTDDQKETFRKLEKFGWRISHLWEYEEGILAVWVVVDRPDTQLKSGGLVHGIILPRGHFQRFEAKIGSLI